MNIDLLIKMTNEIGDFFTGADSNDPQAAARDVANHIKRYWAPRMRAQMLKYYEERQGAGLTDLGKNAVALLYAASKAPTASPGAPAAAAPASPAPPTPTAKGAGT
jgi:formate dehydrogenase subunit delta